MDFGVNTKTFVKECSGGNVNEIISINFDGLAYVKCGNLYLVLDVDYCCDGNNIKCLKDLSDKHLKIVYYKWRLI